MRLFQKVKDGGPESPVDAYFLIELKGLFSVALLKFNEGHRESYHSHAFDALTWFLSGELVEDNLHAHPERYRRGILPKVTPRSQMHRVKAYKDSWCLTLRGPWNDKWQEYNPDTKMFTVLTNGRKIVSQSVHEEITSS